MIEKIEKRKTGLGCTFKKCLGKSVSAFPHETTCRVPNDGKADA